MPTTPDSEADRAGLVKLSMALVALLSMLPARPEDVLIGKPIEPPPQADRCGRRV